MGFSFSKTNCKAASKHFCLSDEVNLLKDKLIVYLRGKDVSYINKSVSLPASFAGKSSLLAASMGELTVVEGQVTVESSIAYVPQKPWIVSGTIRCHLLCKSPPFYKLVFRCLDCYPVFQAVHVRI